jgi:hypothetical protein
VPALDGQIKALALSAKLRCFGFLGVQIVSVQLAGLVPTVLPTVQGPASPWIDRVAVECRPYLVYSLHADMHLGRPLCKVNMLNYCL